MQSGEQQRVLIVRLGAMGDILHALPAVSALRCRYPEWAIGWAVEPQWQALLRADSAPLNGEGEPARSPAQPLVDRIHCVPAKHWARQPLHSSTLSSIVQVRRELRAAGYDAVVDLQGAVRSAIVGRWARPQRFVGEAQPREPLARWFFGEQVATKGVHVIEQAAEVLGALGGDALPLGLPMLPVDEEAARWCVGAGRGAEPFTLLHPGAGWGAKRWPVERYAAAGAAITAQTGCRLAIHVAPSELELGRELKQQLGVRGVEAPLLAPTVGQLIELTRRAALAIGGDTGPLHLAAALGKSTVAIFGPTDPARNGPFHGRFRVLRDPGSRRDHTRHAEPEAGLLRIAPEAVAEAAVDLLGTVPANGERR